MDPQDGGDPELGFDPLGLPVDHLGEYPLHILLPPGDVYRLSIGIVPRSSCTSRHLFELEVGDGPVPCMPSPVSREVPDDDPAGRQVDPCSKSGGGRKSLDVTHLECPLDDLSLIVPETGMMESASPFHAIRQPGHDVSGFVLGGKEHVTDLQELFPVRVSLHRPPETFCLHLCALPGVHENQALPALGQTVRDEFLHRLPLSDLPYLQIIGSLPLLDPEYSSLEHPLLQVHGSPFAPEMVRLQPVCDLLGVGNSGRKGHELGIGTRLPQPRHEHFQDVPPPRIGDKMHLIRNNHRELPEKFGSVPEEGISLLAGCDDDVVLHDPAVLLLVVSDGHDSPVSFG